MPCVGNDVVDLKDAANSGKSRDSRFLKKILTDAEIEYVTHADHPDSALWLLWACKETAYKVIKKILPDSPFLPGRWPVVFTTLRSMDGEGKVGIAEKDGVYVRCFSRAGYVHCIGSDCSELLNNLTWKVDFLPEDGNLDASRYLRYCLRQELARHYSLNIHRITIDRKKQNGELYPPYVYVDGRQTDTEISLSHDGRFVAYAFGSTAQRK